MVRKQQKPKRRPGNKNKQPNNHAKDKNDEYISSITELVKKTVEERLEFFLTDFNEDEDGNDVEEDSGLLDASKEMYNEYIACYKGGKCVRGSSLAVFALDYLRERDVREENFHGIFNAILDIAAAFEIFHAAMLVHDDIIDKDDQRRGRPSSYITLGLERALLLGDLLLVAADQALDLGLYDLARSEGQGAITRHIASVIRDEWTKMKRDVIVGQALDYRIGQTDLSKLNDEELSLLSENALRTMRLKTASYTTIAPYLIGKMIATNEWVHPDEDKEFETIMVSGFAFQIDNDINGLKKDLTSGNISCAMVLTYSEADKEDRAKILECIADGENISDADFKWLQQKMSENLQ